ncbi:MAG TPA: ABC transporter substrate-binding protein [Azospirillaceae bacterium]|nr:ABC transporter substrate-binding protein [Azospirillaceae bacterium]
MKRIVLALAAVAAVGASAWAPARAQDAVRIAMISTLSGPNAGLGVDIRDGFALAVEHLGGRMGGRPVQILEGDDQLRPEVGVQLTERMIEREKVDFVTGTVFSNVALAMMPTIARNRVFYVSPNAGPSALAGQQCSPWFFNVAWQNDNNHEAMGQHMTNAGIRRAYIMAPNYPAGTDALAGFKRYFKGEIVGEVYTPLNQLDYAAELAQLRAANPDGVYVFYPGGLGINFVKQYEQAGLAGRVPLFGSAFTFDQDVLQALSESVVGTKNTAQWSPDLDNPQNKRFVEAFVAKYNRIPSLYASQGYDAALLIDSAVKATGGDLRNKDAVRAALRKADFPSVRGGFRFNTNHYPVQTYYLREIYKDGQGRLTNRVVSPVFQDHADAYVGQCQMRGS